MVVVLVVIFGIPFLTIWNIALNPSQLSDYYFSLIMCCFVLYPVLFLLKVLIMKIQGWHVYLIYGHDELSLRELFIQNEWCPFWAFMTDKSDRKSGQERFPYNVDMGHMRWKKYIIMSVVAFFYRLLRVLVLSALFLTVYCIIIWYFAGKI